MDLSDGRPKPKDPGVQIIPGGQASSCTFVITEEDHTLGNSLRYAVMRNPDVIFCGYSMPHPSEFKVNLRVQTKPSETSENAFRKGLADLAGMADHVKATFLAALEAPDRAAGGAGASTAGAAVAAGSVMDEVDEGAETAPAEAAGSKRSKSKRR